MTLLYAGVFFVAGRSCSSELRLRPATLMDPANLRDLAGRLVAQVDGQHDVADDALLQAAHLTPSRSAAMTGLSVLFGWAMAGRVLRPLQRITATAKRVSQDNLDERIALEGPRDELKELADTFDGMLERLSAAFASQRRFVANASHELRTPLTVIRTELDVTLADAHATNADLRAMGETVRDATLDTERLIQALLTLARSEGGSRRRDPVDLADCARIAVAQTGAEAAARGLDVRPALDPAPVRGDRRLLERLVANLVENAVRHNVDGGAVEVRTASGARAQHGRGAQRRAVVPPDAVTSSNT